MASNIVPPAVEQSESAVISNRLEAYRTDHQTKHPFVVQFPAPQTITQLELATLLSLRGRLHQVEKQVEEAEQSIKTRLAAGAILEPGDHRAELKENFRRNVSWKDVVVRLAERLRMNGEAYCTKVLSSTKPSRTVSLVIE
jgi:hypothetical protein